MIGTPTLAPVNSFETINLTCEQIMTSAKRGREREKERIRKREKRYARIAQALGEAMI